MPRVRRDLPVGPSDPVPGDGGGGSDDDPGLELICREAARLGYPVSAYLRLAGILSPEDLRKIEDAEVPSGLIGI